MPKLPIAAQGTEHGPGHDPRTDHLRPVIDFLLAKGNRPSHWWHESGFWFDQGGELHFTFTDPIDAAELRIIKLPVTSVKVWNAYARNVLAVKMELPPYAVVTRCGSVPDSKSQYKATFTFEEEVEMTDALFEALQLRIKEAQNILQVPFAPTDPKPVAPPKNSKLTKGRK